MTSPDAAGLEEALEAVKRAMQQLPQHSETCMMLMRSTGMLAPEPECQCHYGTFRARVRYWTKTATESFSALTLENERYRKALEMIGGPYFDMGDDGFTKTAMCQTCFETLTACALNCSGSIARAALRGKEGGADG